MKRIRILLISLLPLVALAKSPAPNHPNYAVQDNVIAEQKCAHHRQTNATHYDVCKNVAVSQEQIKRMNENSKRIDSELAQMDAEDRAECAREHLRDYNTELASVMPGKSQFQNIQEMTARVAAYNECLDDLGVEP